LSKSIVPNFNKEYEKTLENLYEDKLSRQTRERAKIFMLK
jgi:hypothetical protein